MVEKKGFSWNFSLEILSPLIGAALKRGSVAKQLVIVKYVAIAGEILSPLIGAALKQGSVVGTTTCYR